MSDEPPTSDSSSRIVKRFTGLVPPLITPLIGPDELDREGLARLIDHTIEGGVHGLFLLGTTGEGPSLSHRLQREVVSEAAAAIAGRVPLLIGITDTSCEESLALARHAAEAGVAAVVIAPPYYFPAGQTELRQYITRLVERSPLPVVLYNMPSLTKVTLELETLRALADLEAIVGVKDSGGDLGYYERLLRLRDRQRPDWSILIGPEDLLVASMRLGGDGGVHGGANVYPRLFRRLYDAVLADDQTLVHRLQSEVLKLQGIYAVGKYASRFIKATKSAASLRGLCGDALAEPFNPFLAPEREQVAAVLASLDEELVA